MNSNSLWFAGFLYAMLSAQCVADDLPAVPNSPLAQKSTALTKDEYIYKAYILRQGIRPPEGFTGIWRTWYFNGNLASERSLVDGGAHGTSKEWDKQGKPITSGEYSGGEEVSGSFRRWFHQEGERCYDVVTYADRRRHGRYSRWTAAGLQLIDGRYANDEKDGRWRWWDMNGMPLADGTYKDGRPWNGTVAVRSDEKWYVQGFENGESLEKQMLEKSSIQEISQIVTDSTQPQTLRWHATIELARRKDPLSKPLLIKLLKDDDVSVRGSAAWGLSQIGGDDAQDALLEFLRTSVKFRNWGDLTRAAETQKELPDKRAVDLLIQCLILRDGYHKKYAAEALGKLGDPKASLAIAQQLNMNANYSQSYDYLYLAAIRDTKGKDATPILMHYLNRLVARLDGQKIEDHPFNRGAVSRQVHYNFQLYGLTITALEAITGRKSTTGTREVVAENWAIWWKNESGESDSSSD